MAFELASAYVELSQRGFTGVEQRIDGIEREMISLTSIASGLATGVGIVGTALAGMGAAFGGLAAATVPMAAKLEQTETQFKTLLGSIELAKQKIEELQNFAASTPFQFEGLADSAKVLLAFGTANEQVIPTLQILGDVAAATGSEVGELANIYGKVKARGALMTEQLDQFNERAIPVGARLAEMFGTTEAEIRNMASSGEISFGDLQRALQGMTQEGGIAFNGMKDQSETLGGLWSTLKDNLTLAMTDIGNAMVEGFDLKQVTGNIIEFVQRVRSDWLPSIVKGFQWLSANIVQPMIAGFQYISAVVSGFVNDWDIYWELAQVHAANKMNNVREIVSAALKNAVNIVSWFYDNVGQIFTNLYNNATWIFSNIVQQMKNAWQSLLDFFSTGEFNVDLSPLANAFAAVVDGIPMPEIEVANLDTYAGRIKGLEDELDRRRKERAEAQFKMTDDGGPTGSEFKTDDTEAPGKSGAKKQFQFVGLTQLAEKMQQQAAANRDKKEQLDVARRNADAAASLAGMASGQG